MDINTLIKERHSTRNFTKEKPDWRDIIECIDTARYSPMSGGIYSLRFILVKNPETIRKITKATQQDFVGSAHYVVIAYSNPSKTISSYDKRGEIYLRQQAGAAIQNFLLKIQEKGLATCWVGHFVDDQIKQAVKIPEKMNIEAILPIGYESKIRGTQKKKREKIELDRILFFEKHGNKKMKTPKKIEV